MSSKSNALVHELIKSKKNVEKGYARRITHIRVKVIRYVTVIVQNKKSS